MVILFCLYVFCVLARSATVLHIGAAVPIRKLDGELLPWGLGAAQAYELAVADLNADLPADSTYSFAPLPVCDTKSEIPNGFHCAVFFAGLNGSLRQRPVGILGAAYSSVTMQMLPITTQQKVLQCSWVSTSADLSAANTYPFFLRTVPPDDQRAKAVISVLRAFNWTRAVLAHTTDRYAGSLAEKFRLYAADRGRGSPAVDLTVIALEQEFSITTSPDKLAQLRSDVIGLIWRSQKRIVMVVTGMDLDIRLLLRWAAEANLIGPGWAWVGVDEFQTFEGAALLRGMDSGEFGFSRANLTGSIVVGVREVQTATTARMRAGFLSRYQASEIPVWVALAYDCVTAIGLAVAAVLSKNPQLDAADLVDMGFDSGLQERLIAEAISLSFEGASGSVSFTGASNPSAAGDRLSSYSVGVWKKEGGWEEKAVYDERAQLPLTITGEIRFSNGLPTMSDTSPGCPAGEEVDMRVIGRDACQPCAAGRYKSGAGGDSCLLCQAGFACPAGSSSMQPCPAGRTSSKGADSCSDCPAGTYGSEAATVLCKECIPGFYQASEGATACRACPSGSFQEVAGSLACESCATSLGTESPGTPSRAGCGCPVGTRWVSDEGMCRACQEGLTCKDFNATPLVDFGYYLHTDAPRDKHFVDVFKCRVPTFCPGQQNVGDPVCKSDRAGLNCGQCKTGLYDRLNSCSPCSVFQSAMLPVTLLAALVLCGLALYRFNRQEDQSENAERLSLSLTAGTAVAVVQKLGVLSKIDINWPSGTKAVMEASAHMLLDFLMPATRCAVPTTLVSSYIMRVCIPHFFIFCFTFWWQLSKWLHHWSGGRIRSINVYQWANTVGLFLTAVHIYASMGVLTLVDCYISPNGKRTVREFSFALCSGPDFEAALPVFAGGVLFYIVGMVGVALYALWVAPTRYRSGSGFRVMVHFLVYKFRPDKYWFALLTMLSAFLLSVVTVVFPDSDFLQLLVTDLVLSIFLVFICAHFPFRLGLANRVEVAQQVGLIGVVSLGLCFFKVNAMEEAVLGFVMVGLLLAMASILLVVLGWNVYRRAYRYAFGQSEAEYDREQLERHLDTIIRGCQEVVAAPGRFSELLTRGASYVERDNAVQLMRFFERALAAEPAEVRKGSRLFLSLRESRESSQWSQEQMEWESHQWEDTSDTQEKPAAALKTMDSTSEVVIKYATV